MMTDPIADFLIQIKNGYLAYKKEIVLPSSRTKEALAKLLLKEGYLGKVEVVGEKSTQKKLKLKLVYENKKPRLNEVKRISSPGKRVYMPKDKLPKVLGGLGITIISTPLGLLTDRQAREKGAGGEIICKLW
jgi:small subunit ribosomal protein S8